ncbi:hypothetical protein GQX74_000261 [Glossina fuscipes]|nr:hypothetical protein GQX74_000261 [Glossina fuscipes]
MNTSEPPTGVNRDKRLYRLLMLICESIKVGGKFEFKYLKVSITEPLKPIKFVLRLAMFDMQSPLDVKQKRSNTFTLIIPFASERHAEIAYRVLNVDQEPRRNFVQKDIRLIAINMSLTADKDEMASIVDVSLLLKDGEQTSMNSWEEIQEKLKPAKRNVKNAGTVIEKCQFCSGHHQLPKASEQIDTVHFIDLTEINNCLFN